jgi:carboxypeptidase A2
MKLLIIVLAAAFACAIAEKTSYRGYKLLDLHLKSQKHIHLLQKLEDNPDFDLWGKLSRNGEPVKVLLSPAAFAKYARLFKRHGITYDIVREDYQEVIEAEERALAAQPRDSKNIQGTFARYTVISSWIDDLVAANQGSLQVSSYIAGTSSEGRGIKVIVIKTASSQRRIWIDCGIHAREWISPATCVWVIDKLIKDYNGNNANIMSILAYYEFHIMPVQNVDGYEFSHTTTRLWRKNRRVNAGSTCIGVDLNRNFPYQWFTGGSSSNPCSDTFAGASAGSELETQAHMNSINRFIGTWDAALTVHTYGKWIFPPYGFSATIVPPDLAALRARARVIINAIQSTYGQTGWVEGTSASILGVASGGTEDWTYFTARINNSFCFELRPGQTGTDSQFGFQLPVDRAPLAGEETYRGIVALVNNIIPAGRK